MTDGCVEVFSHEVIPYKLFLQYLDMKLVYKVAPVKRNVVTVLEPSIDVYRAPANIESSEDDYSSANPLDVTEDNGLQDFSALAISSPRNYQTPDRKDFRQYHAPRVETLPRGYVADSRVMRETRESIQIQAPDRNEIEERQRIMEELAQRERSKGVGSEVNQRAGMEDYRRRIMDIKGNPIGTVMTGDGSDGSIIIGDYEYLRDALFDIGITKSNVYCVRGSVYFTERGKEFVENFAENLLLRRCGDLKPRGGIDNYIERQMSSRNTFDTSIDDVDVHVSLRGKLQIFSTFHDLEEMLVTKEGLVDRERRRFDANTHSAFVKKWIYETNTEFNAFIGELFREMSAVVQAVLTY